MPQVGDVLVAFRANASQFQAEAKKVHTGFAQIRADIKQAQSDMRAGALSSRDYGTALGLAREQALGLRAAGLATGKNLNDFAAIMSATRTRSLGAAQGMGTLRSSLASLAAMSLGAKGTLGTFTSALLFMSVGNLTAIGVIGGIAAAAKGIELLGRKSREAQARVAELAKAWRDFVDPGKDLRADLVRIAGQRQAIEAQLGPLLAAQAQARERRIAAPALDKQITELTKKLDDLRDAARGAGLELSKVIGPALRPAAPGEALAELPPFPQFDVPPFPDMFGPLSAGDEQLHRQRVAERGRRLAADMAATFERWRTEMGRQRETIRETGERFGALFGRSLAHGILSERLTLARVLASVLRAAFASAAGSLGSRIGRALGGAVAGFLAGGPGGAAVGAGAGAVSGSATDPRTSEASPTVILNVPKLPGGVAVVRDPEWQAMWRETARVARSQGFRVQVQ